MAGEGAAPASSASTATWWTMLRERVMEFIHPTATVVIGGKKIKPVVALRGHTHCCWLSAIKTQLYTN